MDAIIPAITSGAVSAVLAAFGCYVAITNRLTKVETLIETLNKNVEKHNQVVERTAVIERDLETAFMRIFLRNPSRTKPDRHCILQYLLNRMQEMMLPIPQSPESFTM